MQTETETPAFLYSKSEQQDIASEEIRDILAEDKVF